MHLVDLETLAKELNMRSLNLKTRYNFNVYAKSCNNFHESFFNWEFFWKKKKKKKKKKKDTYFW